MKAGIEMNLDEDTLRGFPQVYGRAQTAVTTAMRRAGMTIKNEMRAEVRRAGLGNKLANSIRSRAYPESGKSISAAALVWTNAPEIINAHLKGPLIRSKSGFWMAIPTDAAGKGRGGSRLTPSQWEQKTGLKLTFIYRPGRPSLLISEARINTRGIAVKSRSKTGKARVTVPIFILVPQVKLRKRLDFNAAINRAAAALPSMIIQNWSD
ncbi:DUF6441 family protein [Loktanella sp. M215]|uniref:DUF6441 family protein n=1 Tax=Loktanella sp. M215 TaxID=2675431 RepID=UPI001F473387|nr:DUF6441 family protein [Loktanella sp. M215]MCF7700549.1 hypothetical protein [Loktanella sp. M215]